MFPPSETGRFIANGELPAQCTRVGPVAAILKVGVTSHAQIQGHSTVIVCNGQDRHEHFYDGCTKHKLDINQSITVFNWCTQEVISCK